MKGIILKGKLGISYPLQKGMTLRTTETIRAKKKLTTTISEILKYTFFNEKNICVIERSIIHIPQDFLVK